MGIGQKRKRRWGSKSLFGFRSAKVQVLGALPDAAAAAAAEGTASRSRLLLDGFIEGSESNNEDTNIRAGTASKIRRTGSKFISFVRFAVVSGMCNGLELQKGWLKLTFTRYETIESFKRQERCPWNHQ